MSDLQARLDKLLADAEDCDLIANLATDRTKRETFKNLADQYRVMAGHIRTQIEALKLRAAE